MIYLDHAATTPLLPEVADYINDYSDYYFQNPSAIYKSAQKIRGDIEDVRQLIADSLGAKKDEIYFTSGGTESDNWALKGTAECWREHSPWGSGHIITTQIEHHAILHTCENLKQHGFDITYVPVDELGRVDPKDIEAAIRPDTMLISVMYANNEIGTIEPVYSIGKIAEEHNIPFHTDAVQVYGHRKIDVNAEHIDMLSASGHKFGAPKGVGFLYVRNGTPLHSLIQGGEQENGMRAGTENTVGIVGMGKAVDTVYTNRYIELEDNMYDLRNYFCSTVLDRIPHSYLNGSKCRLANNLNLRFDFVDAETLLMLLDSKEICASSGSACTSGSLNSSHVLKAIGLSDEQAHNCVRFTLGVENTREEIDRTIYELVKIVGQLRELSPRYNEFIKTE